MTGTTHGLIVEMPDSPLQIVMAEAQRLSEFVEAGGYEMTAGELRRAVVFGYAISGLLRAAPRCADDDKPVRPVIADDYEVMWDCLTEFPTLPSVTRQLDEVLQGLSAYEPDAEPERFPGVYTGLSISSLNGVALLAASAGECRMDVPYSPVREVITAGGQRRLCCYAHSTEHCA